MAGANLALLVEPSREQNPADLSIFLNFHFPGLVTQTHSINHQMAPTMEPQLPCPFPSGNSKFARLILTKGD